MIHFACTVSHIYIYIRDVPNSTRTGSVVKERRMDGRMVGHYSKRITSNRAYISSRFSVTRQPTRTVRERGCTYIYIDSREWKLPQAGPVFFAKRGMKCEERTRRRRHPELPTRRNTTARGSNCWTEKIRVPNTQYERRANGGDGVLICH